MNGLLAATLIANVTATVCTAHAVATREERYWPGDRWRSSSPEAQGMDSAVLADALDYIQTHRTRIHSLTLVRNGYVVLDATFFPFRPDSLHDVASVTKSITTTLIGIAIGDGHLRDVKQDVLSVFPARRVAHRDARKEQLTLEHLLTMSSGLDCEYAGGERTLREMKASSDWVQFMLDRPMTAAPGSKPEYCSGGMHLLSGVLSTATQTNALEYARRRLFRPLGIRDAVWPADAQGVTHGWGDLHLRPHDMAKIGYLWLNNGRWRDGQIVPSAWMTDAIVPRVQMMRDRYGYGLWVYPRQTPMIFEALGRGGQRISVIPSKNLIVVFTGGAFEPDEIGQFILKANQSDRPLRENFAASRRLAAAVATAARPPAVKLASSLPTTAAQIARRRYVLDENPLRWHAVTFTFSNSQTADVQLEFDDGRTEKRPIGLDGVPRLSPGGRFGLPVAMLGRWADASTFVFDYDEVANINAFECHFTMEKDSAVLHVIERSGEADLRIRARPETREPKRAN